MKHNSAYLPTETMRQMVNNVYEKYGVTIEVHSMTSNPVPDEIIRNIWMSLIQGNMIQDLGSMKEFFTWADEKIKVKGENQP